MSRARRTRRCAASGSWTRRAGRPRTSAAASSRRINLLLAVWVEQKLRECQQVLTRPDILEDARNEAKTALELAQAAQANEALDPTGGGVTELTMAKVNASPGAPVAARAHCDQPAPRGAAPAAPGQAPGAPGGRHRPGAPRRRPDEARPARSQAAGLAPQRRQRQCQRQRHGRRRRRRRWHRSHGAPTTAAAQVVLMRARARGVRWSRPPS